MVDFCDPNNQLKTPVNCILKVNFSKKLRLTKNIGNPLFKLENKSPVVAVKNGITTKFLSPFNNTRGLTFKNAAGSIKNSGNLDSKSVGRDGSGDKSSQNSHQKVNYYNALKKSR